MMRTKISLLLRFSLISAILSFAISNLVFIPINSQAPIAFSILVFAILVWAIVISNRLPKVVTKDGKTIVKVSSNPLPPLVAARTVAFALAGSRAGAIFFGTYFGFVLRDLKQIEVVAYFEHAISSGFCVLLSGIMVVISIWIERKCSPPKPSLD